MDKLRPLSPLEKAAFHVGEIVLCSEGEGKIAILRLQQALNIVAIRHPLLHAVIRFDDKGDSYFAALHDFSVPLEVFNLQPQQFHREHNLQQILNITPQPQQQLFRAFLFVSRLRFRFYTLISHTIADGRSCVAIHDEIFSVYHKLSEGVQITSDASSCPQPLDELVLATLLQQHLTARQQAELDQKIKSEHEDENSLYIKPDFTDVDQRDHQMEVVQSVLSPAHTAILIKEAKQHQITVHGLLEVKMLQAIRRFTDKESKAVLINIHTAVDVRAILAPPLAASVTMLAAGNVIKSYRFGPQESYWQFAKRIIHDIKTERDNNVVLWRLKRASQQMLGYKLPESLSLQDIPWKFAPATLPISNVGIISTPAQYGEIKLHAKYFAVTSFVGKPFYNVATFQDHLVIDFLYSPHVYKRATIEALLKMSDLMPA